MVTTRARTVEMPSLPKREAPPAPASTPPHSCRIASEGSLDYERCREERIRENRERMMKMGILDLASKFQSSIAKSSPGFKKTISRRSTPSPVQPRSDLPPRRSSRLQSVSPAQYSEPEVGTKERGSKRKARMPFAANKTEEVYTEEHEALLGDHKSAWTLFVDGYDANGRRIYDPVKGKTCHQCRQKTMGHRTHCSRCDLVQGQFCGDCLFMRYGENVMEAKENPDWLCPVCRDICNCSLCRLRKGWAPTGTMYKKALSLGFKSVAHYLILTKRADVAPSPPPVSAQRSLSFPDEEDPADMAAKKTRKDSPAAVASALSPESIAGRLRSRVKACA